MTIEKSKFYKVTKYTGSTTTDCGILPGTDAKRLLAGYEYDATFGMWFTPKAHSSYDVVEVND